eukprot:scaffold25999_cov88-Cyclotella_meneghiniana.AAC.1
MAVKSGGIAGFVGDDDQSQTHRWGKGPRVGIVDFGRTAAANMGRGEMLQNHNGRRICNLPIGEARHIKCITYKDYTAVETKFGCAVP